MPKQSKIKSVRPGRRAAAQQTTEEEDDGRYCVRCGKWYNKRKTHFSVVQSDLYAGNKGYLPVCGACLDELYDKYREETGSTKSALRRLCMMFDIYWNEEVYAVVKRGNTTNSAIKAYISRSNLIRWHGKTYDDTIKEEGTPIVRDLAEDDDNDGGTPKRVPKEVKDFWGPGLQPAMYKDLQERYDVWVSKYPEGTEFEPGEEALLRQICSLELDINQARANGKATERLQSQLDNTIGSLKLKPSQKRDSDTGYVPFGMDILKLETSDPIWETDEKYKDIDGLQKYVATWYTGAMCAMAGIDNKYRELFDNAYESLLKKWEIERPSFEDDEEETSGIDFFKKLSSVSPDTTENTDA